MTSTSSSPDSPGLRASDAEREHVAEALRRHHLDGRLDTEELQERLERAYAARTTGELAPLLADLPGEREPARRPRPSAPWPAPPLPPRLARRRRSSSRSSSRCCRSRRPAPSPTATPGRCRSSRCWCCCASRGGARAAGPCGGLVADHPALIAVQRGVAVLTMALIATQFFLAGAAAFGATSFDAHKAVGSALVLVVLLAVLVAALVRRFVVHAAVLLGVTVLQLVLGSVGADEPWIGAFHGLNALAVMGVGGARARRAFAGREPAGGPRPA